MPNPEPAPERWAAPSQHAPTPDTSGLIPVKRAKEGTDLAIHRAKVLGEIASNLAQGAPANVAKLGKKAAKAATLENLQAVGVSIAEEAQRLEQVAKEARKKVMDWPDDIAAEMKRAKKDLQQFAKDLKNKKKDDTPTSDFDLQYEMNVAWLGVKQQFQPHPQYRRIQVKPLLPAAEARHDPNQTVARLFTGCRLEWTTLGKLKTATDVSSAGKDAYKGGKDARKAGKAAFKQGEKAAQELKLAIKAAKESDESVFAHLGEILEVDPGLAKEFALDIGLNVPVLRPVVAGIKAGAQAVLGGLTVSAYLKAGTVAEAHPSEEWMKLSVGALRDLLMQKIVRHSVLFGTYTYDTVTGIVDPTSVSAIASIGVRTAFSLHAKYQLFKMRKEINAQLQGGSVDLQTVHACPLLGCYLLYMMDPSVIKGYFHDYDPAKISEGDQAKARAEHMEKYTAKEIERDDQELAVLNQLAWKRLRACPLTLIDAQNREVVSFSKSNKIAGLWL